MMENTPFALVHNKNKYNCNDPLVENISNDDFTEFDNFINQLLHCHDDDYQHVCDQIKLEGPNDDFDDPMLLLCDEILEDYPLMDEILSEVPSSVQVNDDNNHTNNNVVIVHKKGGDYNQQQQQQQQQQEHKFEEDFAIEEPLPIQMWDDNSLIFDNPCSSCQVLREIMHTKGMHTIKLEIHGVIGLISHAVIVNNHNPNDGIAPAIEEHQILDFSTMNYNMVKEYMKKYVDGQRQKGYTLMQESLSPFYEALCIGFDWSSPNLNGTDDIQRSTIVIEPVAQTNQGETSYQVTEDSQVHRNYNYNSHQNIFQASSSEPLEANRISLSIQRERTKNMGIKDIAIYFDRPVKEAAKELSLCDTVVKNKLRSFGVNRWPYRKVEGLKSRISRLRKKLEIENAGLRMNAEIEIQMLQQQINEILAGNLKVIMKVVNV